MEKRKYVAVTLVEILITLIIIAILAALALPQFTTTRERSLAKEAKANLKLIDAAEKIYRMEEGFYYPWSGTVGREDINSNLKISLSGGDSKKWDYTITGSGSGGSYTSKADRPGESGYLDCQYTMSQDSFEPQSNSNCP